MAVDYPEYNGTGSVIRNVYIHIPFCETKCPWCYIPVRIGERQKYDSYFAALKSQIGEHSANRSMFSSSEIAIERIYFGGGTANTLSPSQLAELLACLRSAGLVPESALVTLEVLPNWSDSQHFNIVRRAGFNRISVAAQSFHDSRLSALKRSHSSKDCIDTVIAARKAGIENVVCELMWGYGDCALDEMADDFRLAIDAGVNGITSQWFNTTPNGTPPDPNDRLRLEKIFNRAKEVALKSGFYNPSTQVFSRSDAYASPNGNNGPGIAQTDYGGVIGFGWGAKSFIGRCMGKMSGTLNEYLTAPNRDPTFETIDSSSIELGYMLYNLTAHRCFDSNRFIRIFDYHSMEEAVTPSEWLSELELARLVQPVGDGLFRLVPAGDPLLDLYMAWLGLNNRGGIRA